jgi:hypothetical protein
MNSKTVKDNLIITLQKKKDTEYVVYINHKKIQLFPFNHTDWYVIDHTDMMTIKDSGCKKARYKIYGLFKNKIKIFIPTKLFPFDGCEIKVYPLVNNHIYGDPYVGYYKEEIKK